MSSMKNEMIISAWDGCLPDKAAEERMLSNIIAFRREQETKKRPNVFKRLAAAAACIAVMAGAGFGIRTALFNKDYAFTLPSGQTVVYERESGGSAAADAQFYAEKEVCSREISYDEFRSFFPTLTGCFSGGATFAADTGELLHFEGWLSDEEKYFTNEAGEQVRVTGGAGQLHICMSKEGLPVTDTIVSGNESYTEVDGVPLKTGYFVTKPNSRGKRTAIFFAEYTQNGVAVYAELSGDQSESGQIGERLTEAVYGMITNGSPDLSAVRY